MWNLQSHIPHIVAITSACVHHLSIRIELLTFLALSLFLLSDSDFGFWFWYNWFVSQGYRLWQCFGDGFLSFQCFGYLSWFLPHWLWLRFTLPVLMKKPFINYLRCLLSSSSICLQRLSHDSSHPLNSCMKLNFRYHGFVAFLKSPSLRSRFR